MKLIKPGMIVIEPDRIACSGFEWKEKGGMTAMKTETIKYGIKRLVDAFCEECIESLGVNTEK